MVQVRGAAVRGVDKRKSPWEYAIVCGPFPATVYRPYRQEWRTIDVLRKHSEIKKQHPDAVICVRDAGDPKHGFRVGRDDLRPGGAYNFYTKFNYHPRRKKR